jgi:hypothetical protein
MLAELYTSIQNEFATNELLSGGIGVALFSALLYLARKVPGQLWRLTLRQTTVQLTIYNDDFAYMWINEWLAQHSYSVRCRRIQLGTLGRVARLVDSGIFLAVSPSIPKWSLSPGPGHHFLWYKGPVWVWRHVEDKTSEAGGRRQETLRINTLGRNPDHIRALVAAARELVDRQDMIDVHLFGQDGWSWVGRNRLDRHPTWRLIRSHRWSKPTCGSICRAKHEHVSH